MGKGKRLKQERVEAVAAPATADMLMTAVIAVGDVFGADADCASAAALLKLTADSLGFELTPRSVSLYARQPSTNDQAFMGPKATAMVPETERHRVEDHYWEGRDTGHMILTSEQPRMLFDPNLRQLRGYGMEAPSLGLRIASTSPSDGGWTASLPDLELIYLLDDNTALWDWYEDALVGHVENAADLALMIRAGLAPAQIRDRMKPRAPG